MPTHVLCEAELRIEIDGGGDRALLVVTDSVTVRFWTDTALLEAALGGEPVQLSSDGRFCLIEVERGWTRLSFGLASSSPKRCEFPAGELAEALAWVRAQGAPHELPS